MTFNPYEAPKSDTRAMGVLSGNLEDVKAVAKYQKGLILCILVYLIAVIVQFALPAELRLLRALGFATVSITALAFVFLLATKVYGTAIGVLLGILTLIPIVGLVVLLIVNGKATHIIKQNGFHVGFFGANLSQFR